MNGLQMFRRWSDEAEVEDCTCARSERVQVHRSREAAHQEAQHCGMSQDFTEICRAMFSYIKNFVAFQVSPKDVNKFQLVSLR